MKKIIIVLNLLVLTLFISGCGCSKKTIKHFCSNSAENENFNYDVKYEFEADSKTDVLIKYTRKETYTSDEESVLEGMQQYKQEYFTELNKLDGFEYKDTISDNKLTTELVIDFSKTDREKLLDLDIFYINFYDENDNFNVQQTIDYYIGEKMSCS